MDPVFVDLHIHTSDDPDNLTTAYDLDTLKTRVSEFAEGSSYLIALTDHNVINKSVYLDCDRRSIPVILGAELHIEYSPEKPPYHCHIFFDVPGV